MNRGEGPGELGDALPAADVGGSVAQTIVGNIHACTLLDAGALRCWGAGVDGRLGYASTESIGGAPDDMPPDDVVYR